MSNDYFSHTHKCRVLRHRLLHIKEDEILPALFDMIQGSGDAEGCNTATAWRHWSNVANKHGGHVGVPVGTKIAVCYSKIGRYGTSSTGVHRVGSSKKGGSKFRCKVMSSKTPIQQQCVAYVLIDKNMELHDLQALLTPNFRLRAGSSVVTFVLIPPGHGLVAENETSLDLSPIRAQMMQEGEKMEGERAEGFTKDKQVADYRRIRAANKTLPISKKTKQTPKQEKEDERAQASAEAIAAFRALHKDMPPSIIYMGTYTSELI